MKTNVVQRTVVCKLICDAETEAILQKTANSFAHGARIALGHAEVLNTNGKFKVQKACYREIRETCGLSANLAIRSIARACEARKAAQTKGKKVKAFRPTSVSYDSRIFSLCRVEQVSLTTVAGRIRIPLSLGDYQRRLLDSQKPTAAVLRCRGRAWYIHIVVEDKRPVTRETVSSLGVDRGIYNIAVTSTGRFFSGRAAMHRRERFAARRRVLQSLGTKGAKRALRRLSGKESRWMRDVNHCIGKAIVEEADRCNAAIVLEDLKDIRDRTKRFSKVWRRRINAWAFRELETLLGYKAMAKGLPLAFVEAAYSSCTCPRCGVVDKRSRKGAHFRCTGCGYRLAADFAAARTVAGRHACPARAAVNQPMASVATHALDASPAL